MKDYYTIHFVGSIEAARCFVRRINRFFNTGIYLADVRHIGVWLEIPTEFCYGGDTLRIVEQIQRYTYCHNFGRVRVRAWDCNGNTVYLLGLRQKEG